MSNPEPSFSNPEPALFDFLASAYDEWFEEEGKLIFAIEVQSFQGILDSSRNPGLKLGWEAGALLKRLA